MSQITRASPFSQPRPVEDSRSDAAAPTANVVVPATRPVSERFQDGFAPAERAPAPAAARPAANLHQQAQAAEERVMATATQCADVPGAVSLSLTAEYAAWSDAVQALVRAGKVDSPEVKSFASKTQQVALLQQNLPSAALDLDGPGRREAVSKELSTLFTDSPDKLISENPLLLHPSLTREPSLESVKARGVPTTSVVENGKPGEVRSDVVMVYCPGVVRTGKEFESQKAAAMKAGVGSVLADTGSFNDAELNAQVIAGAVKDAKKLVGNPDAKVILVGYSQGATNILAFMRDQGNDWANLRNDVAGIHMMHPASGGSQLADLAVALGRYLFEDAEPTAEDMKLLRAYYAAKAEMLNLPPQAAKVNEEAIEALRNVLKLARNTWGAIEGMLDKVGIDVPDGDLRQRLAAWMQRHENLPESLANHGLLSRALATKLEPVWDRLRRAYDRAVLTNPEMNGLMTAYLGGGLQSLTTQFARSLTTDPRLRENLATIPVLNSVGSVPEPRLDSLVPSSQKLNMAFFKQLGLESDYQVSVPNQKLEARLPTAVDLPTEAVGHWGVAGLEVGKDHPKTLFKDFSPDGLVHSAITAFGGLGVL